MTQTTLKTSTDKGFQKHYSYDSFSDPKANVFSRKLRLPNEYMDRVSSFMIGSENGSLWKQSGKAFLLDKDDEKLLFTQFNYAKKMMNSTSDQAKWEKMALDVRETIINANIFLVPSVMKTINGWMSEAQDLTSEGLMGLMRAVHKFDVERGGKFSTYAYYAIRRAMIRHMTKKQDRAAKVNDYNGEMIHQEETFLDDKDTGIPESLRKMCEALDSGKVLDERETLIINRRFPRDKSEPPSLRTLGAEIDLTAERVRQIQDGALQKLRQHMQSLDLD